MEAIGAQEPIVIVGAGQAGFSVASKLRDLGHEGSITLIGNEAQPPYQRPPLSKAYLLGEMTVDRLYLRPEDFYRQKSIQLRLSTPVASIDRTKREVILGDGTALPFARLVLATGSRPKRLPAAMGGALDGVYYVRNLADIDAMSAEFQTGRRLLVVGGGYIGLEAAAVASKLGLSVTLIEAAPRILQRVAAKETSDYFRKLHVGRAVDIREGIGLQTLAGEGRVSKAVLADGSELPVDFVVVGIGVEPNVELAVGCGLDVENGVKVDEHCRTFDPAILAAGDCASFPWHGTRIRLESVGNAIDQAESVAMTIVGWDRAYEAKPWFWSDQFDIKLQIAGLSTGHEKVVVRSGHGEAISFWYYRGTQLIAVDAMNDPRAYMVAKRLIDASRSPDPELVVDPTTDLKSLLCSLGDVEAKRQTLQQSA